MISASRATSVSLGRHTGDERRRLLSPLCTADVLLSYVPRLPRQMNGAPGTNRMQRSALTFRAAAA
jgi:hypothetical protein